MRAFAIDDVCTSAASLEECARMLRLAASLSAARRRRKENGVA